MKYILIALLFLLTSPKALSENYFLKVCQAKDPAAFCKCYNIEMKKQFSSEEYEFSMSYWQELHNLQAQKPENANENKISWIALSNVIKSKNPKNKKEEEALMQLHFKAPHKTVNLACKEHKPKPTVKDQT